MSKTTPTLPPGLTIIEKPASEVFTGHWIWWGHSVRPVTHRRPFPQGVELCLSDATSVTYARDTPLSVVVPSQQVEDVRAEFDILFAEAWEAVSLLAPLVGEQFNLVAVAKKAADIIRADRAENAEWLRCLREELGLTGDEGWHQCFNEIQRVLEKMRKRDKRTGDLGLGLEVTSLRAELDRRCKERDTARRDLDECRTKLADAERELERARACGWPKPGEEAGFRGFDTDSEEYDCGGLLLTDEGWERAATLADAVVIRPTELGVDVPVVTLEPPSIPSWDLSPADEAVVGDLHRKARATATLDDALDPTTQPGKRERSAPPPSDSTDHVAASLTDERLEHARRREVTKQAEEKGHHRVLVGGEWACECRVATGGLASLEVQGRTVVIGTDGTAPLVHPAPVPRCGICGERNPSVKS